MELPAGTIVAGRYEVDQLLGRGGMAAVYRVYHTQLGTSHALKVIAAPSGSVRERLLREGRLQGQIHHPNVVAVTDHVEVGGLPGLVLEMVEGPSLAAVIGGPPLSVEQIDLLGSGILAGVAEAHRHRLVHRDLKPGNVLIAIREGRPVPKVTDFGLAVALDDDGPRSTRTGAHLGTPQYMAPEQVRDAKSVDERADVWALGVLLYELATGRLPFDHADRLELYQAIAAGHHRPVEELRPDLPQRMVTAIASALRVDREERPLDAVALAAAWGSGGAATVDPLVGRLMSLAPSPSSRGTSPVPANGRSSDAPATWAPDTRALEAPGARGPARVPAPPPVTSAASSSGDLPSDSLPPPPSPVPARPASVVTLPAWVPVLGAVGILGLAVAVVLSLPLLVWSLRPAPTTVVVPVPTALPVPEVVEAPEPTPPGLDHRGPPAGTDLLLDARFADAAAAADMVSADPGSDAEILSATAQSVTGGWYAVREELLRGTRAEGDDGRSLVFLEMLSDVAHGDAWLAAHPDDLEVRVLYVATACPGPSCGEAVRHADAIEARFPGRSIGAWAQAVAYRGNGRLAESEVAWKRWADQVPDEPMVTVERGRWLAASGRYAEAAEVVAPLLVERRAIGPAWGVAGIARRELGEPGAVIDLDGRVSQEIWYHQVAYARTVAAWEAAHGDQVGALARLQAVKQSYARYNRDALVQLVDLEVDRDRAIYATDIGDARTLQTAAVSVGEVRSAQTVPWALTATDRTSLLIEGLRQVARQRPADAARVLEQLEAAGATSGETEPLRTRL